jgi:hypothetical protein
MTVVSDEASTRWRVVDDEGVVIANGFQSDAAAW